eukprot:1160843-Pelagomonas_calceolata.AAC.7
MQGLESAMLPPACMDNEGSAAPVQEYCVDILTLLQMYWFWVWLEFYWQHWRRACQLKAVKLVMGHCEVCVGVIQPVFVPACMHARGG